MNRHKQDDVTRARTMDPWKFSARMMSQGMLTTGGNRGGKQRAVKWNSSEFGSAQKYVEELLKSQAYLSALSGIPMVPRKAGGGQHSGPPTSASIDRIDSDLPYCPGNIRVVCKFENYALNQWRDDEILPLIKRWAEAI